MSNALTDREIRELRVMFQRFDESPVERTGRWSYLKGFVMRSVNPHLAVIWSCRECGARVDVDDRKLHFDWHHPRSARRG